MEKQWIEWTGVRMGAHWVINVYIALGAPVIPILASYWPLPRRIHPYRPRDSGQNVSSVIRKNIARRTAEKSLIGSIRGRPKRAKDNGDGRRRSDRIRAFPKVEQIDEYAGRSSFSQKNLFVSGYRPISFSKKISRSLFLDR